MTSRDAHIRRYFLLTHQVVMKTRNTSETLLENSPFSCYVPGNVWFSGTRNIFIVNPKTMKYR